MEPVPRGWAKERPKKIRITKGKIFVIPRTLYGDNTRVMPFYDREKNQIGFLFFKSPIVLRTQYGFATELKLNTRENHELSRVSGVSCNRIMAPDNLSKYAGEYIALTYTPTPQEEAEGIFPSVYIQL